MHAKKDLPAREMPELRDAGPAIDTDLAKLGFAEFRWNVRQDNLLHSIALLAGDESRGGVAETIFRVVQVDHDTIDLFEISGMLINVFVTRKFLIRDPQTQRYIADSGAMLGNHQMLPQ